MADITGVRSVIGGKHTVVSPLALTTDNSIDQVFDITNEMLPGSGPVLARGNGTGDAWSTVEPGETVAIMVRANKSLELAALAPLYRHISMCSQSLDVVPHKVVVSASALGGTSVIPPLEDSFSASVTMAASWSLLSPNYVYTIPESAHNLGVDIRDVTLWDSSGDMLGADTLSVAANGNITVAVSEAPDGRFTGDIVADSETLTTTPTIGLYRSVVSGSDWVLSGTEYVYTIPAGTHGLGTTIGRVVLWSGLAGAYTLVESFRTRVMPNGDVEVYVTATPDGRFSGKVIIEAEPTAITTVTAITVGGWTTAAGQSTFNAAAGTAPVSDIVVWEDVGAGVLDEVKTGSINRSGLITISAGGEFAGKAVAFRSVP